jgi:hypothetical protein
MSYFRDRAEELGLSCDDVAFRMARLGHQITSAAVRSWFNGTVPGIGLADPLAEVLQTDRLSILEAMHSIAVQRSKKTASQSA